jgi:hypothetical protein
MRRMVIGLLGLASVLAGTGCGAMKVFLAMAQPFGAPMIEAKCPLAGKRVVLLCASTRDIQWSHSEHMDRLATEVWREMQAKVPGIDLVPLPDVRDLRDTQTDFDMMTREQIGKYFKSDVVVELEVNEYTLAKSGVELVLRGHAAITARAADVHRGGRLIWQGSIDYTYPKTQPRILGDTDRPTFAREFLRKLAVRVTRSFYTFPEAEQWEDA